MLKSSLFVMPKIYCGGNENSLLKAVIVFIYAFFLYSIPLMKSNNPNTIDMISVALLISSYATIAIASISKMMIAKTNEKLLVPSSFIF
ncbi:hypothetical protein [Niallia taxi]|uniref:Uncharacterized protein n=1 Tax=Niallia taxi TaxID=2499688 RepID=A0A3S2W3S6_9BACI|nr:hypothetical protein [Niallia taxi]RVT61635.1 hypothetical protein EM808_15445 [Niallia taxi]